MCCTLLSRKGMCLGKMRVHLVNRVLRQLRRDVTFCCFRGKAFIGWLPTTTALQPSRFVVEMCVVSLRVVQRSPFIFNISLETKKKRIQLLTQNLFIPAATAATVAFVTLTAPFVCLQGKFRQERLPAALELCHGVYCALRQPAP